MHDFSLDEHHRVEQMLSSRPHYKHVDNFTSSQIDLLQNLYKRMHYLDEYRVSPYSVQSPFLAKSCDHSRNSSPTKQLHHVRFSRYATDSAPYGIEPQMRSHASSPVNITLDKGYHVLPPGDFSPRPSPRSDKTQERKMMRRIECECRTKDSPWMQGARLCGTCAGDASRHYE